MIDWEAMSIADTARELGRGLQCFERRVKDNQTKTTTIRFPRGVIRTTSDYVRTKLSFLPDDVVARNIAYTLQATDVNRWLVNRFDLGLSASSLFYKQACVTLVSAMEAVLSAVWHNRHSDHNSNKRFADVIDGLAQEGVLSRETAAMLNEARRRRNDIHLHRVTHREGNTYNVRDYNNVVAIEHRMIEELRHGVVP